MGSRKKKMKCKKKFSNEFASLAKVTRTNLEVCCHGPHLHRAHDKNNGWIHQIYSKLWNIYVWLCGGHEGVLNEFLHALFWSRKKIQCWIVQGFHKSCEL